MTSAELLPLVEQNLAGLDAALMLHRLQAVAVDQRRASETGSTTEMQATLDHRDRVMATRVTVERELKGVPAIAELHRQAADLVADIVAVDQDSVQALKNAEQARHLAAPTGTSRLLTLALQ